MYTVYRFGYTAFVLLGIPFFLYRWARSGKYLPSWKERLGFLPASIDPGTRRSIWVHAVSVGEVGVTRTLLPLLRDSFPEKAVFVSVTTLAGRQIAERQLREADGIFYCPFDWRFSVRRVVARIRPDALLLMETEIWPQLLRSCREAGAVTLIVNGRISDRSYPRYRRLRVFLRRVFRDVDGFCMQSAEYARRVIDLGAEPCRVRVTGSIKFDAVVPGGEERSSAVRLLPANRPVLIAGSTLAPEEEIVLEAFAALRRQHPDLYLVLAPRHPERFREIAELAASRGFRTVRRSALTRPAPDADVMVLDTIGELASVYEAGDVIFVGGSLAAWGGHNVIEPAALGKAVVFGPSMSNFREIASLFLEAGAAVQVEDREGLRDALVRLLGDADLRRSLGARARELVEANRGAGRRTIEIAREKLKGAA